MSNPNEDRVGWSGLIVASVPDIPPDVLHKAVCGLKTFLIDYPKARIEVRYVNAPDGPAKGDTDPTPAVGNIRSSV